VKLEGLQLNFLSIVATLDAKKLGGEVSDDCSDHVEEAP
jgi:hypothetical protein